MLMQKSTASYIRSWDDLAQVDDVHPVVIGGGSTMTFLKVCNQVNIVGNFIPCSFCCISLFVVYLQESTEAVSERIWYKCESSSSCLVSSNEEGVRRAR